MSQLTGSTDQAGVDAFLSAHPEILVGRDALDKAEKDAGDDTFSIVNKPLSNVVLVQHFNPETLKRIFAVALVNDKKAEEYYKEENQDEGDGEEDCKAAQSAVPDPAAQP